MATQLTTRDNGASGAPISAAVLEKTLIVGDLQQLTPGERVSYYLKTCESLGLNPLTKPFEYLELPGERGTTKLVLYANRNCTDQLRDRGKVDLKIIARELVEDVYIVTARATLPDGRTDESIGAVPMTKEDGVWAESQGGKRYFKGSGTYSPLRGDSRANAIMKAETKAKRRVTLSIIGLGFIDESEIETIQGARRVEVDHETGEIKEDRALVGRDNQAAQIMREAGATHVAITPPKQPRQIAPGDWKRLAAKAEPLGVKVPARDEHWSQKELTARYLNLEARCDYAEVQGMARATGIEAPDLPEKCTASFIRERIEEVKDKTTGIELPGEPETIGTVEEAL